MVKIADFSKKTQIVFINSLNDLIREVIAFEPDITKKSNDNSLLWYRGHSQSNFNLVPRLYRKIKINNGDFWSQLGKKEQELLADFKIRNYHLLSRLPENELTWMTIMQHYGTSTRMLDWSEQLLVSLFFALDEYMQKLISGVNYVPCIWCLKPIELNKSTIKYMELDLEIDKLPDMFSIYSEANSRKKKAYKQYKKMYSVSDNSKKTSIDSCWPLAINSPYNNERIRAQSGTFTLFPSNNKNDVSTYNDCAMEKLTDSHLFLRQFIILKPVQIRQELKAIGFKKSIIFPELPVIADELDQDSFNQ